MKQQRIAWLDGLKGLACMGVFIHHFGLAFFGSIYLGKEAPSVLWGVDTYLATAPLGVFLNGSFWVCVFLLIGAYLAAVRIMSTTVENKYEVCRSILLKRYPRLMLPAFAAAVINYCVVRILTHFHLNFTGKVLTYGPRGLLHHGLLLTWVKPSSELLGPYWTLYYLLFGSFFAVLLAMITKKGSRVYPFLLIFCTFGAAFSDAKFVPVVLGVLAADLTVRGRLEGIYRKLPAPAVIGLSVLIMLAGLFFGGYPSFANPENIYRIFDYWLVRINDFRTIMHGIGAFLLILGLLMFHSQTKKSILAARPCLFLGKIGYSVYLVHIMWIEYLGYYLMTRMNEITGEAGISCLPVFLVIAVLVIVSALIFHLTVEKWSELLIRKLFARVL